MGGATATERRRGVRNERPWRRRRRTRRRGRHGPCRARLRGYNVPHQWLRRRRLSARWKRTRRRRRTRGRTNFTSSPGTSWTWSYRARSCRRGTRGITGAQLVSRCMVCRGQHWNKRVRANDRCTRSRPLDDGSRRKGTPGQRRREGTPGGARGRTAGRARRRGDARARSRRPGRDLNALSAALNANCTEGHEWRTRLWGRI